MKKLNFSSGQVILYILLSIVLFALLLTSTNVWIYTYLNFVERRVNEIRALNIAEAGIEYYRWYLNHFPEDFTDGTGLPGPYYHNFQNRLGETIGQFILDITKPATGTTIVDIKSTGKLTTNPEFEKIIKAKLGRPSLAKYIFLIDDNVRFGEGTVVYGEIHSNKGIRFDGIAYNLVKSALITYSDPDHSGCKEWAVHTHVSPQDPCPPSNNPNPNDLPPRPDVFKVGRKIGVPTEDFIGISTNLSDLKSLAINNGVYFDFSGDNNYGYELILKENGTFDVYKVTSIISQSPQCRIYDTYEGFGNNSRYKHSTWSIRNKQFIGTYNYPSNGVIFIEDNVWVSGKIKNQRLLIASARFPENLAWMPNITINSDLLYTNYDGSDVIGLIAQKNINIGLKSEDDLRIDAAMIAQNGRVGRYYYSSECGPEYKREKIAVYGSIISRLRYGFSWVSGDTWVSGYRLREIIYNGNLLYSPPPFFPLASEFYNIIKWHEIK
ncbi:MAG: hypothetical protein QXZ43_04140 [Candidatus Aenigmatarchaeota archaeon]